MIAYIDRNRDRYGVEPICAQLPIAPSTYRDAKARPPSARQLRDTELQTEIARVHADNFGVYGGAQVLASVEPGRDHRRPVHRQRRHSTPGGINPSEFERRYAAEPAAV
jgi:putative transposase